MKGQNPKNTYLKDGLGYCGISLALNGEGARTKLGCAWDPRGVRRAQAQIEERRKKYQTPDGRTADARYSSRHLFSTLIKCEHCGKSFCRRKYTYVNTREYWICSTNSQCTAVRYDNRVKIEEAELLQVIRTYLASLIQDTDSFVKEILAAVGQRRSKGRDGASADEIVMKRKRLSAKRSR